MKVYIGCFLLITLLQGSTRQTGNKPPSATHSFTPTRNIFIITIDGLRWQEVFQGADPALLANEVYTPDPATMKLLYDAPGAADRRMKLLPFFWQVISSRGQLYGNRELGNKANTSNPYSISYPGYSEMLTGRVDLTITTNKKQINPNRNILEFLANREEFRGRVAAFTSWDVFPYILSPGRGEFVLNSGYGSPLNPNSSMITESVQRTIGDSRESTRHDELTYLVARDYIGKRKPRVVFIGFGETDEAAHQERYDHYLEKANEADRMIAKLWHMVQTTPGYKDQTTFIITTDHGRGRNNRWADHGIFVGGSSQTWLAAIGPNISPLGEARDRQQIYQEQVAQTIAGLIGEKFETGKRVALSIPLK